MKEFVYHNAVCTNVVDGDTLDVSIDVGFDFQTSQRLRLYGFNTPERNEPGYLEAKQFVLDTCYLKPVQITTYKKDSFGRWISIVYVDGQNLNEWLLSEGLAEVYKY
ncbi:thermonuclease family protein [Lysinibacillus fusiformis]|uniref:thermonuclease family protein n=1 Tax=Lysinibacillus fusiformis TaxID=28031 RepID=UPI003CFEEFE4